MTKKINVLYIDDEDNNLNSFKGTNAGGISRFIPPWMLREGLSIAKTREFEVVIADQRMAGNYWSGVFLKRLVKIQP